VRERSMTGKTVPLLLLAGMLALPVRAEVSRYLLGSAADVSVPLSGPAHDFEGGAGESPAGLQWMIDQVRGCTSCPAKLDIVVVRASDANDWNDFIYAMKGVDSVETLVLLSAEDANTEAVETTIRNAEVVFFAGGDQCKYVRFFKGSKVETAVEAVYARGGGVGGSSAGLAIQGDLIYDGCTDSARSPQALADPYHPNVTFTYDLFHWPNLQNVITDTHFVARDRVGRTLAFIARQIQDGKAASVLGLAVEEDTSVVVDKNGLATVLGKGPAYFILGDHPPEVCKPGVPLTFSNFKLWRVPSGGTFDLKSRPASGYYLRSVTDGVINAPPY
jgi:cyanophycinase